MKNRKITRSLLILFNILIIGATISCKTIKPVADTKDLSYLYNPVKTIITPRYSVVNQTDESSTLSIKFFAHDLFFSEANPKGIPTSEMQITVRLYNISQGKLLVDTAGYNINIVKEEGRPEYVYSIPLKVEKGVDYTAEIRILDLLRQKVVQSFVPFNTLSYNNRYNFKAVGNFRKNELFYPVVRTDEYFNLIYQRTPVDSLYISFYKPFREIPYPPSMILPAKTLDYDPEKFVALAYSDTTPIMLPKEGVYFFSVGRDIKEGYTFMNFGPSFPSTTTPEVMIEPLAYIATQDELSSMRSAVKPKVALDDFWVKCGGNIDKARELIRIYYTRVLFSNYYFTSFTEGWRTERGMIYIIYGPPDKIYKNSEGESWGYKKSVIKSKWGNRYSVSDEYIYFNFKRNENMFTDNDYYLRRNETMVTYWDKAIASWRKGVVFRLDNPEGF